MSVINYYIELELDKNSSLLDINKTLDRLSRTYQSRLAKDPKAAQEKLQLIRQARLIFVDEKTRLEYDRSLNPVREINEKDEQIRALLDRAYELIGKDNHACLELLRQSTMIIDAVSSHLKYPALLRTVDIYIGVEQFDKALELISKGLIYQDLDYFEAILYYKKYIILKKLQKEFQELLQSMLNALNSLNKIRLLSNEKIDVLQNLIIHEIIFDLCDVSIESDITNIGRFIKDKDIRIPEKIAEYFDMIIKYQNQKSELEKFKRERILLEKNSKEYKEIERIESDIDALLEDLTQYKIQLVEFDSNGSKDDNKMDDFETE